MCHEGHGGWRGCMCHQYNIKNHTYKWCTAYFKQDRTVKKQGLGFTNDASQMSGNLDGLFSLCILEDIL